MSSLAGPVHAVLAVLVVAGAAKLTRPGGTAVALRAAGLPGGRSTARCLGAAEVAVGAAAIVTGAGSLLLAAAAMHLGFAAFAATLSRRASSVPCGCFGDGAPVSGAHIATSLIAAAVLCAGAAAPIPNLSEALDGQPAAGVPYVVLVVVLAGLEIAVLTAAAELRSAVRTAAS